MHTKARYIVPASLCYRADIEAAFIHIARKLWNVIRWWSVMRVRRSVLQPHFQLNRWSFSRLCNTFSPINVDLLCSKSLAIQTQSRRIAYNPLHDQQGFGGAFCCRAPCNVIWFVRAYWWWNQIWELSMYLSSAGERSKAEIRMATRPRLMKHGLSALDRLKRKSKQTSCTFRPRRFLQMDNCYSLVHFHPPPYLPTCSFLSIENCPPQ